MKTIEIIQNKLCNGEPINAVQYVRLEQSSNERKRKIKDDNGTSICKKYLDKHPNIVLAEKPYVDCNFLTRNLDDRDELAQMIERLGAKDVDLVLVDDIYELTSSFADSVTTGEIMFRCLDIVVLDMKSGTLYDSTEKFKCEIVLKLIMHACVSQDV